MRAAVAHAVLLLVLVAALAGAALADPGTDKERVDAQLGEAQGRLDEARARETVLTSELTGLVARERTAQASVGAARAALARIEGRLARQRALLDRLGARLRDETERLRLLDGQLDVSVGRLERRVRELYMADEPDLVSIVVGTDSFSDLLDDLELLGRIGRQDEEIVAAVGRARDAMRAARAGTRRTRDRARRAAQAIAAAAAEQRSTTLELTARRDALADAAAERRAALGGIREDKAAFVAEVESLQAQSASLAEEIRRRQEAARAAATAAAPSAAAVPSGGGRLAWPVGGLVTSGFGTRWGRMHEGIDIAVPEGTPVAAAAAGTVILAGWTGGYGNLVVIDHGDGLATAYGHNSSVAVTVGEAVGAGQTIAYSGSTGHSTGPHVHFEVRVGGAAVDPLGYL